ncbi:MAG: aldo/keto reductase [Myxococcota bacterium]
MAPSSKLGLGGGPLGDAALDDAAAARLIAVALDLGVGVIDTAPSYGASEDRLGRHLGPRRRDVALVTKVGYGVPGHADWTGPCVALGIDRALGRLRTDHLDAVLLHSCPAAVALRDDIVGALVAARDAGKVRAIGYSGDNVDLDAAVWSGLFGVVETSVSVVDQRALGALRPGVRTLAKRPLANAPWRDATLPDAPDRRIYVERWRAMALSLTPAEVLRFAAYAPGVDTALVGTASEDHLRAAASAVAAGPLPDAVVAEIRARFAAVGFDWPGVI